MDARIVKAANAYANTANSALSGGDKASGSGFADFLENAAGNAVENVKKGEEMAAGLVTGNADLAEVASAIASADVTLKGVIAVRDKVIAAYQDIIKMPI